MAAITTTGAGNWSSTTPDAPWPSGTIPVAADTVTIAHDVGGDYTPGGGADHCAGLTINSGKALTLAADFLCGGDLSGTGTLACRAYNADFDGAVSGALTITGNGAGRFAALTFSDGAQLYNLVGANATSRFTFRCTGTGYWRVIGQSTPHVFRYVTFNCPSAGEGLAFRLFDHADVFESCDFDAPGGYRMFYSSNVGFTFRDCYFYNFQSAIGFWGTNTGRLVLLGCVFGKDRSGTSAPNNPYDLNLGMNGPIYGYNCKFNGATPLSGTTPCGAFFEAYQQAEGDWRKVHGNTHFFRSTAAKKSGDYGIECALGSDAATTFPFIDIPIPVNTGDTVSPSIYYQNVTADLDLEAAAGRLVFELDPGDEWGLNEVIDVNGAADSYTNWRQVTFTGGTAGGTAAKGTVILRVTLARYVATGVVYLADMAY